MTTIRITLLIFAVLLLNIVTKYFITFFIFSKLKKNALHFKVY